MKIEDYQCLTQETAIYPKSSALEYLALGLASESGEVASIVKKKMRDKTDKLEFYDSLVKELGDCLWYISQICNELGVAMSDVMILNIDKLLSRQNRGVIKGSGDNR